MTFLAFSVRPSVVIPDHRPLYKIVQVLLVLYLASNGKKSSMVRLQMFNWALKSSARRDKLAAAAQSGALDFPAWGFDPALDAAVALAKADGLLEATTTGVKLTEKGAQFCALATREEVYDDERALLSKLKTSITEKMVQTIVNRWV